MEFLKKYAWQVNLLFAIFFLSRFLMAGYQKLYFNVLSKNCYLIDYFTPIENFVKFQPIMESSMSTIIIK